METACSCMKFVKVQDLLKRRNQYPDLKYFGIRKIVELAFLEAESDRSTYVGGIRPLHHYRFHLFHQYKCLHLVPRVRFTLVQHGNTQRAWERG